MTTTPDAPTPLLLDSITDAGPEAVGRVLLSGSHGGRYPAALASHAGARAVAFNDAGIGVDRAGVAGVLGLDAVRMAAIAADCMSCRIGSATDLAERGVVSVVNAVAARLGVAPGMTVADATALLTSAPTPTDRAPSVAEARREIERHGLEIVLVDSASLVRPEDAGRVVIAGSHGALIGGDPKRALKARARIAAFNDAGGGVEGCGVTRLPALDAVGVASVAVSADSARIGEAASSLETGVISAANAAAAALGARTGLALDAWLATIDPTARRN